MRSWLSLPGLLQPLFSRARLAVRLVREPRVPVLLKALPLLAAFYVISPVDFAVDALPVVGQLDDLGFLLLALELFVRLCPEPAVAFHRAAIAGGRHYSPMPPADSFIDAEWRREG